MSKLGYALEKKLEIPAFSQESLLNLIQNNKEILVKDLDTSARISIHIEPNLDLYTTINNTTIYKVPSHYLPLERFNLDRNNKYLFSKALEIQALASQDEKSHAHHYGHSIFRKLAIAVNRLEKLLSYLSYKEKKEGIIRHDAEKLISYLLTDGTNKLTNTSVNWEYKDWGSLESDNFQRFDSKKLSELVGGPELFEKAIEEARSFDVYKYIDEFSKNGDTEVENFAAMMEGLKGEVEKLQEQGVIDQVVNKEATKPKKNTERKPIVFSLSQRGSIRPASAYMADKIYNGDEDKFRLINVDGMKEFVWWLEDLKEQNLLQDVTHIIINSAPPYFVKPSLKHFQLMMKYEIYNRGLTGFSLDYNGGCVDDIKGIVKLIRGEYPELPEPIVLCDTLEAWESYENEGFNALELMYRDEKYFQKAIKRAKRNSN